MPSRSSKPTSRSPSTTGTWSVAARASLSRARESSSRGHQKLRLHAGRLAFDVRDATQQKQRDALKSTHPVSIHPEPLRCFSATEASACALVAPCGPGASTRARPASERWHFRLRTKYRGSRRARPAVSAPPGGSRHAHRSVRGPCISAGVCRHLQCFVDLVLECGRRKRR
jgi:hypothetical protein